MTQAYGLQFSRVYDILWSDFARNLAPRIERFYTGTSRRARKNRTLLDLCCGSGQLAAYFVRRGFAVTGLDLSGPMLDIARKRVGEVDNSSVRFIEADAARFQLDRSYGLVVSTYDALNHLPDLDSLRGCLESVGAATIRGGYFIFDLNTRQGLKRWNGITVTDTDTLFVLQRGLYPGASRAYMCFTGFVKEGDNFARFEEHIYNTVFDLGAVQEMLRDTHWTSSYFARADDFAAPISEPEREDRVWIVAKR